MHCEAMFIRLMKNARIVDDTERQRDIQLKMLILACLYDIQHLELPSCYDSTMKMTSQVQSKEWAVPKVCPNTTDSLLFFFSNMTLGKVLRKKHLKRIKQHMHLTVGQATQVHDLV